MRAIRCQAALLAVLVMGAACVQAEEAPLRIALTKKLFWHDEPEDVVPQAQLIGDQVGERIERDIVVEGRGEDVGEVYEALTRGEVDIVVSDGLDYARLQTGLLAPGAEVAPLPVRPVVAIGLVTDSKELALAGCTRALLVVSSELDARDFSDLEGRRLVYSPESENDCAKLFLESLTRRVGAEGSERFFSKSSRLGSCDACVISLQFGGADVTCIPELMYLARQMVAGEEMRGLDVLARSSYYTAYVCFYLEGRLDDGLVR
ncbi:MAG: PhnD/SsuA/transferrin family substrate-binding protein, partial [Candidatus Brocadiaceae bacterium]